MTTNFPTYELEDMLEEKGYSYIAGVDEAGRGCEHPSAEVLTSNGWKYYYDLAVSDRVLSYTSNDTIEWQRIDKIIEKDFDGDLIELKNRGIHILVTGDHYFDVLRRTFKRDKSDNNKLKLTGYVFKGRENVLALKDNDFIPRGGKWSGSDVGCFVLPAIEKRKYDHSGKDYSEKIIPMPLWIAFLGIFLSEGWTNENTAAASYVVGIRQINEENYLKIKKLLSKLPFDFSEEKNGRLIIRHRQLHSYLKRFGKVYTKYIPKEIKDLPPNLLNILIDWMVIGDGSCYRGKNRKEVCCYYTVSERLRNDFEEILLKAGWTYHTSIRQPRDGIISGKIIKKENCVPCFGIRMRRNIKAHIKSLHKHLVPYKGKVFCLSLPKHHNFFIRRSGSGYFTGNSGSGPVVAAAVRIPDAYLPTLLGKVKDSKKMSAKKREEMYEVISRICDYGVGVIDNRIIDEINILEATKLAMRKAVNDLSFVDYVLVDGTVDIKGLDVPQKQVIRGDNLSVSIAAASIVAKVTRDELMMNLHYVYPIYNWIKNKGYLTKEHIEMIKLYGASEFHRKSFNKVGRDRYKKLE